MSTRRRTPASYSGIVRLARAWCFVGAFLAQFAVSTVAASTDEKNRMMGTEGRVTIADQQRVTASGYFASREKFITEICRLAKVEVRRIPLGGEPITVQYHDHRLHSVLRDVLRSESYVLGIRNVGNSGATFVVWLDVLGGRHLTPNTMIAPESHTMVSSPFLIEQSLLLRAFAGDDPNDRAIALADLEARIVGDPDVLRAFLRSDVHVIVDALARFPSAAATLRKARDVQSSRAVIDKLDSILSHLRR